MRQRIDIALKAEKAAKVDNQDDEAQEEQSICNAIAEKYLGCSFDEYMHYLENQFNDRIHWENIRDWEIDHIVPISQFDLSTESGRLAAFHYTNTQPLHWMLHNIKTAAEHRHCRRKKGMAQCNSILEHSVMR